MEATVHSSSSSSSSSSSCYSFSDWAWLPKNALLLVLNKLLLLSDMVKFSSVCTNWRDVVKVRFLELNLRPDMPLNRNLPVLLIPSTGTNGNVRNFYSINRREVYDLNLQVAYTKRCSGSSQGWLITLDCDSFEVNLINPFYFGSSKGIIRLPVFSAAFEVYDCDETVESFNFEYFIFKAVLSSDPISSANVFVVMVIYGDMRKLAFWKPGAKDWTHITWCLPDIFDFLPEVFDVIYVQGRFLAVTSFGQVFSCETEVANHPYHLTTIGAPLFGLLGDCCRRYLVELPDRTILQAIRTLNSFTCDLDYPIRTTDFLIYQFVVREDNGNYDWILVQNLMDGALFLGDNFSHFVSASQFPGCSANSVYFTDDCYDTDAVYQSRNYNGDTFDFGVFLLEERCIERSSVGPVPTDTHYPPPIWILPTI